MKKILIALLVVTMASSVMIAGCSNKTDDKNSSSDNSIVSEESSKSSESSTEDSSSSFDSDSSKSESISSDSNEATDGDFVWEDGKYITDLSEEGAKKKEIVIPEKCQKLKIRDLSTDSKFSNNENLESVIFKSENIKSLPDGLFDSDKNLKKVELPKSLKKVSEWLFLNCNSLESVEIPDSVTEIEDGAFENSGIKELKIPESVTTVGESVFKYTKIEKIYLPESLTEISKQFLSWLDDSASDYKLTIYVKKGSYADEHFDEYQRSGATKEYY